MNINDFPVKKELKNEIAQLVTAYMAAIGIDVSDKQQQEFQDRHSEDLIDSVLDAIVEWQEITAPHLPDKSVEQAAKELYMKCEYCNGDGYTSEHDDNSRNYESGEHDCSGCPIQVQCEKCMAKGFILAGAALAGDKFEFAEWVTHNDYTYLPSKKYWVNEEQEELNSINSSWTTAELYQLFIQSKNK